MCSLQTYPHLLSPHVQIISKYHVSPIKPLHNPHSSLLYPSILAPLLWLITAHNYNCCATFHIQVSDTFETLYCLFIPFSVLKLSFISVWACDENGWAWFYEVCTRTGVTEGTKGRSLAEWINRVDDLLERENWKAKDSVCWDAVYIWVSWDMFLPWPPPLRKFPWENSASEIRS